MNSFKDYLKYDGLHASDYYYVLISTGMRKYYSRRNDRPTKLSRIPNHILANIKPRPEGVELKIFKKQLGDIAVKIKQLGENIHQLKIAVSAIGECPEEEKTEASQFYYVYNGGGRNFYSRQTNKQITFKSIPARLQPLVKLRSKAVEKIILVEKMTVLQEKRARLLEQAAELETKLGPNAEAEIHAERKRKLECQDRHEEQRKKSIEELHRKINPNPNPNPTPLLSPDRCLILLKHGILTKNDWNTWLLKNHPDKGGTDVELCKEIISAGQCVFNE